jgi:predicted nucleic acid-binding protein
LIVVDASALLEVLLESPDAERISRRMFSVGETLHAPHLLDLEITQALRRYVRSGVISSDRGAEALSTLSDLPIIRYPHLTLLPRIWEWRHNLTAYDGAYLALAEALDAPLVTRDRALQSSKSTAHVEVI